MICFSDYTHDRMIRESDERVMADLMLGRSDADSIIQRWLGT